MIAQATGQSCVSTSLLHGHYAMVPTGQRKLEKVSEFGWSVKGQGKIFLEKSGKSQGKIKRGISNLLTSKRVLSVFMFLCVLLYPALFMLQFLNKRVCIMYAGSFTRSTVNMYVVDLLLYATALGCLCSWL